MATMGQIIEFFDRHIVAAQQAVPSQNAVKKYATGSAISVCKWVHPIYGDIRHNSFNNGIGEDLPVQSCM